MTKEQALHSFWSSFGLMAYDENTVPDDAKLPYITYNVSTGDFGADITMNASLFYRSNSWVEITNKSNEIEKYLGRGGKILGYDDGALWIKRNNPFAQRMSGTSSRLTDTDKTIRQIVLSISVEYIN